MHYEGVVLRPLGLRMLERLPASLAAVCMVMCDARAPEALCSAAGDVEQPAIICGDCGIVHPTRDTVKHVKGSLVCKVDCGLLPHSSRKGKRLARESADHEPPAPIDATNSASYPPPVLYKYRTADSRGPGSKPAVWFKQMTGKDWWPCDNDSYVRAR